MSIQDFIKLWEIYRQTNPASQGYTQNFTSFMEWLKTEYLKGTLR